MRDQRSAAHSSRIRFRTSWPRQLGQASPLTLCPPPEGRGSQPDGSIYRRQFDCINAAHQRGSWVRAHLLHGETTTSGPYNLHGSGKKMWNLIIADKSLNGTMSSRAESPIIDLVYGSRAVLWYESKVDSYVPDLDYFAQSITVDAGFYDTIGKKDGFRLPGFPKRFEREKTPPHCPA